MNTNSFELKDTWFIYIRTPKTNTSKGRPIGCICLIRNEDGTFNRGISICSPRDGFVKRIGKQIAFNRAKSNRDIKMNIITNDIKNYMMWSYNIMEFQMNRNHSDLDNECFQNNIFFAIDKFPIAETSIPFKNLKDLERQTINGSHSNIHTT